MAIDWLPTLRYECRLHGVRSTIGFFFCACGLIIQSAGAVEPLEKRTEEIFPFPREGALTVENTDGSIQIYGSDEPRLKLIALRKAYTMPRLHDIRVETRREAASIAVITRIPAAPGFFTDRSGTVDYTIIVPATAKLERLKLINGELVVNGLRGGNANLEIVNGKITARNCFAHLRGRANTGALEVFYDWWENLPASFDFALRQGRIYAKLPAVAQFAVDAQTANGHVANEFHLQKTAGGGPGQSLKAATTGDASVSLVFRTGGGNISIDAAR